MRKPIARTKSVLMLLESIAATPSLADTIYNNPGARKYMDHQQRIRCQHRFYGVAIRDQRGASTRTTHRPIWNRDKPAKR